MTVSELLTGSNVGRMTVSPESSLSRASRRLLRQNAGALIVEDPLDILGVVTAVDLLAAAAETNGRWADRTVGELVNGNVSVALPDDELEHVVSVMLEQSASCLPVVDDGELLGLVSLRDVVSALIDDHHVAEARHLHDYPRVR